MGIIAISIWKKSHIAHGIGAGRALVLILGGLLAAGPAWPADTARQISLHYSIHLGGFGVGSVAVDAELANDRYRLRGVTRTDGLIDMVVGFLSNTESRGAIAAREVRPAAHRADNVWMGEDRFVRNAYRADGVTAVISPPPADDDRPPVPRRATVGTLDPLSASLRASLLAGAETPCAETVPVFDGRRRYDLHFSHVASARPAGLAGGRPSQHCQVSLDRLAGFSRKPWLTPVKGVEIADIWFKSLVAGLPPLPIRLTADTGVGEAVVRLETLNGRRVDLAP